MTSPSPPVRLDLARPARTGFAEAVYAPGKTHEELIAIVATLNEADQVALVTRIAPDAAAALSAQYPDGVHHKRARLWQRGIPRLKHTGLCAVLSAGTADLAVAEEAALTLAADGRDVARFYDVGVAGIERLVAVLDDVRQADVIIVVAGMDGALPSVVAGLVRTPVIAVPTSVGYGAAFQGVAPLLSMLNACAEGLVVVNIDNGFGAARAAARVLGSTAPSARPPNG